MASQSDTSSQSSSDLELDSPTTETAAARPNRGGGRRRRKAKKAEDYDEKHPRVAVEAAASQARGNPGGASTTPVTVAIVAIMGAFPDHVFQLQEIKKDHRATVALLKRLRFVGFLRPTPDASGAGSG